jgi:hypothetical protein
MSRLLERALHKRLELALGVCCDLAFEGGFESAVEVFDVLADFAEVAAELLVLLGEVC